MKCVVDVGSFESFSDYLATQLRMTWPAAEEDMRLEADLGLDSLARAEAALILEELGACAPGDMLIEAETLGDLYHILQLRQEQGAAANRVEQTGSRASLRGPHIQLVPVRQSHYEYLYQISSTGSGIALWRHRGAPPEEEYFREALWSRVLVQFMCELDGRAVGLVTAYDYSIQGTCYIAVLAGPEVEGTGLIFEGLALFVEHLFSNWRLRRVFAESLQDSWSRFSSLPGQYWEVAGQLVEHAYVDGAFRDLMILSLSVEQWHSVRTRIWSSLGVKE